MIYTTNSIESLNSQLRRSVRTRGHFPSDEAAMKLIWLQLREITKDWTMPHANGAPRKLNSLSCSVIGSRSIVNQPAQHTKLLTGSVGFEGASRLKVLVVGDAGDRPLIRGLKCR